jgi:hypothetical protein
MRLPVLVVLALPLAAAGLDLEPARDRQDRPALDRMAAEAGAAAENRRMQTPSIAPLAASMSAKSHQDSR